jgi:hypothetical protein
MSKQAFSLFSLFLLTLSVYSAEWTPWERIAGSDEGSGGGGIDVSYKQNAWNEYSKGYEWVFRFRNRYSDKVNIGVVIEKHTPDGKVLRDKSGYDIKAGGIKEGYWFLSPKPPGKITVERIKIGDQNGITGSGAREITFPGPKKDSSQK